jgi:hypothetical protein
MYLARRLVQNRISYIIRESYREGGVYRSRDLMELGQQPQRYIHYSGSYSFTIDDRIARGLQRQGVEADPFELEKLFYPFLDPLVRQRIEAFADRQRHRRWKPASEETRREILAETHEFDRRRAHFLRFGQVDQRRLNRCATLYRKLRHRSRDELEQHFLRQEWILSPQEYKLYIYAIFDLQRFFTESFAQSMPEALNVDKMDEFFLKQLCRLDRDEKFWQGMERGSRLSEHLVRYVIMYFDYSFASGRGVEEYIRNFIGSRRRYAPPKSGRRVSMSEAATIFGLSRSRISSLTRTELKRLFRQKAHELHPDRGGSHEQFIELSNAYQEILRTKAGKS